MTKIVFAAISPHPPIILPTVGSKEDRTQVKNTIQSLESLGKNFKALNPDSIFISSPHPDWGFDVPLFYIAKEFNGKTINYLTELEEPKFYFEEGKRIYKTFENGKKYALIASGDLSHRLREDGPYGFAPDGPEYDKALIEYLKNKDINNIFRLDEMFPEAAECGLRSFCFFLGVLEEAKLNWQPEILSYEGPFGVGYLVASFKLK